MPQLFAITLFLSATLLFLIQPMIAKMLLPLLGGTPAVWNTCMVFFQALLLAGYTYAHATTNRLKPARQAALHLVLLVLSFLWLPIGLHESASRTVPTEASPLFWLLGCLLWSVGLPFFILSTTAPLLQKWFSQTHHPSATDPYFLYAASNAGSLGALVAYPGLMEPNLTLTGQAWAWAAGYLFFSMLICLCLVTQLRSRSGAEDQPQTAGLSPEPNPAHEREGRARPSGRAAAEPWATGAQGTDAPYPPVHEPDARPLDVGTSAEPLGRSRREEAHFSSPESQRLLTSSPTVHGPEQVRKEQVAPQATAPSLGFKQRLRWTALAFVPSSLLLSVTTYLTTDVASIPLLWVFPLALYLLSFVVVFARRRVVPQVWAVRALPIAAISLAYLLISEATQPAWMLTTLHLLFFFIAALVCHGRLAEERPPASHLTEFYFWMALGGMLGGCFNALLAPLIFTRVTEYPVGLVLACLLRPAFSSATTAPPDKLPGSFSSSFLLDCRSEADRTALQRKLDFLLPLGVGLIAWLLMRAFPREGLPPGSIRLAFVFGGPALLAYFLVDRPVRFSLALGAILWASSFSAGSHGWALHTERNFYGVLRVTRDPNSASHRMVHGNTIHGRQFLDPARQSEPLSYYSRSGPLGQIFAAFDGKARNTNVAVVGLGAGSMAAYARPHQIWTVYEINPAVIRLARNTNYFTFLHQGVAADLRLVLGDARLRLREAGARSYDLLILDAFSSDAIPTHLLTREAIDLYLSKLAEGGILAFHISNRCLNLQPVLGALAAQARLICHAQDENDPTPTEHAAGKDASHWVVMARRAQDLGRLAKDGRWLPVETPVKSRLWTDDFSNILSVFKWD